MTNIIEICAISKIDQYNAHSCQIVFE